MQQYRNVITAISLSLLFTQTSFAAISKNLNPGDTGEQVKQLQVFLILKGHLPSGADDGIYGTSTTAGIKAYQRSVRLPALGIVGPLTRKKINADLYQMWYKSSKR